MANVIGESFNKYVDDQVTKRQNFLKSNTNYSNEFYLYNSKTSFVRLTSGVTVDEGVCNRIGFNGNSQVASCKGDNLAKNFILFSAQFLDPSKDVTNIEKQDKNNQYIDSFRPTAGVGYGYGSTTAAPSQGFLSTPDFGYVPPPGIESATIKTLNKGTLKEATINITAHNLLQFRVIEALFLRLRYSLLLEWGHNVYLNNSKNDYKLNQIDSTYDLYRDFLKNPGSQKTMQTKIENLREKSCGNYDAFLGVIKNFNWSLKSNGTYAITIIAISTGDVIDSLKVNTSFNLTKPVVDINTYFPPQFLKSTLHAYCRQMQLQTQWNYAEAMTNSDYYGAPLYNKAGGRNTLNSSIAASATGLGLEESFPNNTPNNLPEAFKILFPWLGESAFYTSTVGDSNNPKFGQYYIRLGALLRFIEAFLLLYDTSGGKGNEPAFRINHDRDENRFLTIPLQISTDPMVCIIPVNSSAIKDDVDLKYEIREYNVDCDFVNRGGYILGQNITSNNTELGHLGFNGGTASDTASPVGQATFSPYKINQFYIKGINIEVPATAIEIPPPLDYSANPIELTSYIYADQKDGGSYSDGYTHKNTTDGISRGSFDIPDWTNIKNNVLGAKVLNEIKTKYPNSWLSFLSPIEENGATIGYALRTTISYFTYTTISKGTSTNIVGTSAYPVGMPHIQYHLEKGFRFNKYSARTMDILVNLGYVMEILDTKIDKNGDIDALKFLKSLMDGIGGALGGINDFEVTFDDVDNTFRIIDNTYVANTGKDNITELQINTLTSNSGTFVQDVSLKTELTSRIANAIAAGAQKNGNTMVSNGATFAKFNEGYVDRIIEKKQNKNNTGSSNDAYGNRLNILFNYITKIFALVWDPSSNIQVPSVTSEEAQAAAGVAKDIYQYELGDLTTGGVNKEGKDVAALKGTMFIPLNLQVTVDGMSGIKQYQMFKTNQELLPSDYHNRLAFVVKGLTHKIDDKGWSTTIETLAVKRFNKGTTEDDSLGTILNIEVKSDPPKEPTTPSKDGPIETIGGDKRYQPIKDIAARGEGVYDSINGSARGTGINNNRISVVFGKSFKEWTISEITQKANNRAATTEYSSAVGKYQQLGKYLLDRAEKAGLDPDVDKFNEVNQEKICENLISNNAPINNYIKGINEGSYDQLSSAVQAIGQVWTSKPVTKSIFNVATDQNIAGNYGDVTTGVGNTGHRWGDSSNPKTVKISVAEVVTALISTRKNFVDNTKSGIGGLPKDVPPYYI